MPGFLANIKATPRLNADQYTAKILSAPLYCLQKVKEWLEGYVKVTSKKTRDGDYRYRQLCLDLAEALLEKIASIEKSYPEKKSKKARLFSSHLIDLDRGFKLALCDFKDTIAIFFAEEEAAKIPRKKNNSLWQICSNLFYQDKKEEKEIDYQSIFFLEDLEALFNLMQSYWLMAKDKNSGELTLFALSFVQHDDPAVKPSTEDVEGVITLEQLKENKFLKECHINWNSLYKLMACYAQMKVARFERLAKFSIAVPYGICRFNTVKFGRRQILRNLFAALAEDKAALLAWCDQYAEADFRAFFAGAFGDGADSIMEALIPALKMPLAQRLQDLHKDCKESQTGDLLMITEEGEYDISAYKHNVLKMAVLYKANAIVKQSFIDSVFAVLLCIGRVHKHEGYYLFGADNFDVVSYFCSNLLKRFHFSPQELSKLSVDQDDVVASYHALVFTLRAAFEFSNAKLAAFFSVGACEGMNQVFQTVPQFAQENICGLVLHLCKNIKFTQKLDGNSFKDEEYQNLLANLPRVCYLPGPRITSEGKIEMQKFESEKHEGPPPIATSRV